MSKAIPSPGTTVILRKLAYLKGGINLRPKQDAFAIIREHNAHDIRVELKGQPFEAYIPKRFFTSNGSDLEVDPPIISIPMTFTIETLPL